MENNKQTTEEQILEAAEKVFLSKGFQNSKISDIAELAGANNALINYYFRSKENLFNKVLHNKIELLAKSISNAIDQDLPFWEVIKDLVETQFDFFNKNELLPRFVLSEVLIDEDRTNMFREQVIPVVLKSSMHLNNRLQEEIAAGRVRDVKLFDLLYTMISLNALCFLVKPIMGTGDSQVSIFFSQVMDERKKKNVEIIMSYLKNTGK